MLVFWFKEQIYFMPRALLDLIKENGVLVIKTQLTPQYNQPKTQKFNALRYVKFKALIKDTYDK